MVDAGGVLLRSVGLFYDGISPQARNSDHLKQQLLVGDVGAWSSKRQVRGNFQTDKQKKTSEGVLNPLTPLDPPLHTDKSRNLPNFRFKLDFSLLIIWEQMSQPHRG